MPPSPPTASGKAPQQRALATRKRILDASIDCLVEKGYADTSIAEVCRRCRCQRGTVLHHFPTKAHLMTLAVGHVLDRSLEGFHDTLARHENPHPNARDLAAMVWEIWSSDIFYAWLELVVASRTEPDLNLQVRTLMGQWEDQVAGTFQELFSREQNAPVQAFFWLLNALSIEKIFHDPDVIEQAMQEILEAVDVIDRLFMKLRLTRKGME